MLGLRYRQLVTFEANVFDCSNFLAYVRCCFNTIPWKSPCSSMVWLFSYTIMPSNLNRLVYKNFPQKFSSNSHQTQVQGHFQQEHASQPVPLNIERYRKAVSSAPWVQCTLVAC